MPALLAAFCLIIGWSGSTFGAGAAPTDVSAQTIESPQATQLKLIIKKHANANNLEAQRAFVTDLFTYGDALDERYRPDEKIAFYDELISHFSNSTDEYILTYVAYATFDKGTILGNHHRDEQAIAVLDAFIDQFIKKGDRYINLVCGAHNAKAHFLADHNGKFDMALASYNETIKLCGAYPANSENTHLQAAEALKLTAEIQEKQDKLKDAANSLDEIVKRYANSASANLKTKAEDAQYKRDEILKRTQSSY